MGPDRIDIAAAESLDRAAFVARFGSVFEHSPWVAEAAWERRPFGSVEALHAAMTAAVAEAPRADRLALIRAHPDLAARVALTDASAQEQASAGVDRLDPARHAKLTGLTAAYRARFGFPFVVCVREHTADSVIAAAERRLAADPGDEERTALSEIAKIASLRLADLVAP